MSITFHLYRPNYNVEYIGTIFDNSKINLFSNANKKKFWEVYGEAGYSEDMDFEDSLKLDEKIQAEAWSDGKMHKQLNLNHLRGQLKVANKRYHGSYRRTIKRLENFPKNKYTTGYGVTTTYIPVDEVLYNQGWFLKRRFFKRKVWTIICTTKKQVQNFIDKYATKKGANILKEFVDKWEDGMIFQCGW